MAMNVGNSAGKASAGTRETLIIKGMARGWESKSVESQIEDNQSTLSNSNLAKPVSNEEVHRKSRTANLHLSRKRILQELEASTNERYSEMLRRTLADLDGQLKSGS
jgi:hypothetical protein